MKYGFGVDLGGTTVKIAYFDETGTMLDKWEIPTVTENSGKQILPDIASAVRGYLTAHAIPDSELRLSPRPVMEAFRDRLNDLGITATIRASRGEDIMAACGMLAGKDKENSQTKE